LLDDLLPVFTRDTGWTVKTLAVGSGQALELGRRGEADVLLVHSPAAEMKFMAEGKAGQRRLVMHNDFVIVGPADDPAGIKGTDSVDAMKKIAAASAVFISRGDDSGTNAKENDIWARAGITPKGAWYQSTGQGMGATLRVADQKGGYTLSDRATYLAQRDTPPAADPQRGRPEPVERLSRDRDDHEGRKPGAARRGEGVRRLDRLAGDPAADR
jgi:tungstate transport system substrate-binding protein